MIKSQPRLAASGQSGRDVASLRVGAERRKAHLVYRQLYTRTNNATCGSRRTRDELLHYYYFFPTSKSLKMSRISQQLPFRRFVLGLKSCFGNCEEERKNPPMGIGTSSYVTRHLFFGFLPFPSLCFFPSPRAKGRQHLVNKTTICLFT